MRGLQIAVFAALFIYTACAAPSIVKRTSLPTQGTPGSLRPRGSESPKGKGKSTQGDNTQTEHVPDESASCKGKGNHDYACCNYGPNSVQYAWERNKGALISQENSARQVNQVYLLSEDFKGKTAVIKVIPEYHGAVHQQVIEEATNLELVGQSLGFGVMTDPGRFAIDLAPRFRDLPPMKGPFTTYFIVMPYLGEPRHNLFSISEREISILQHAAVTSYLNRGMRRDRLTDKDWVYTVKEDPKAPGRWKFKADKAAISDWTSGTPVTEEARIKKANLHPRPEEFCSHVTVPPKPLDPKTISGQDS